MSFLQRIKVLIRPLSTTQAGYLESLGSSPNVSRVDASVASPNGTGRGSGQPMLAEAECDRAFLYFFYFDLRLFLGGDDQQKGLFLKI